MALIIQTGFVDSSAPAARRVRPKAHQAGQVTGWGSAGA